MGKILAIAFLLLFIWVAIPHIRQGEWLAPTAIAPNSWITQYDTTGYAAAAAIPIEGYGWFQFDFWKHDAAAPGRPVTKSDFAIRR